MHGDIVTTSKRPKHSHKKQSGVLIMVVPKQTPAEISRRTEIREALHDLRAKVVHGKMGVG
jgi:hypothetical protein